jgi:hypothetical protein
VGCPESRRSPVKDGASQLSAFDLGSGVPEPYRAMRNDAND